MLIPTDGMVITTNTTLAPGVYVLPAGITIAGDGVTLDGNGATILGAQRQGSGVRVEGRQGVTIHNLRVSEFYHGIAAHDCTDLKITNCTLRNTAEEPPNTLFLDIWRPVEQAYGSGILLHRVRNSLVAECDVQHQQNGLLCYDCKAITVRDNIANHCSGFGFHFFNTSDCVVSGNYADFCCRYEPRGPQHGHLGADSAGFLIAYNSRNNTFKGNFARMSGDGFFLAGFTPSGRHVPCDGNVFEGNDASYSPNIGFEATFSRKNVFRDNVAYGCNYGFWLGFSTDNVIEHNRVGGNRRAGIAVENGVNFTVRDNRFQENRYGVLLWSKFVENYSRAMPENDTSRDWLIESNEFVGNDTAIRIAADQDHGVRPMAARLARSPAPRNHRIARNFITGGRVSFEIQGTEGTVIEE